MATISCSGCSNGQNFHKGMTHCAYCGRQYSGEKIVFSEVEYVREKFIGNWYVAVMILGTVVMIFSVGYLVRAMMNVFSPVTTLFLLLLGTAAYCIVSWLVIKFIAKVRTVKLLARQKLL